MTQNGSLHSGESGLYCMCNPFFFVCFRTFWIALESLWGIWWGLVPLQCKQPRICYFSFIFSEIRALTSTFFLHPFFKIPNPRNLFFVFLSFLLGNPFMWVLTLVVFVFIVLASLQSRRGCFWDCSTFMCVH